MKTENDNRAYEIATIVLAYLSGRITPEQQMQLDAWLEESEENRCLFMQMTDEEMQEKEIRKMWAHYSPDAWTAIRKKVTGRRNRKIRRICSIAAAVMIMVGASWFFVLRSSTSSVSPETYAATEIVPGRTVARLTVANGSSYLLHAEVADSLPHTAVLHDDAIVFRTTDSISVGGPERAEYSKLEIPRGGEYTIVLADGTRVFLNSETTLKFPESFSGYDKRVVYLTGEAYFEVARNEQLPFIVKCGEYDVKVLGTAFNVSNYADNNYSHTTLKEGKVEIIRNSEEIVLKPGQQAKLQGGHIEVREVNVENYTSWMNDNFRFESENIEEILKRIARWYVVDIFYANSAVKEYHFSGYLPRYADIKDVLELLSLTTNVQFEVKGKTVVVGTK